jgi:hypothetical protein
MTSRVFYHSDQDDIYQRYLEVNAYESFMLRNCSHDCMGGNIQIHEAANSGKTNNPDCGY